MRPAFALLSLSLALACASQAAAQSAPVERIEVDNRVTEGLPEIPEALVERLARYQNTRGASLGGWTDDGCLLITTRFAETAQAHRVCEPLGMREQLTFHAEPINSLTPAPMRAPGDSFVFGKDVGGNENWQLYRFDLGSRETTLLTDGKARNQGPLFSGDGRLFAWSSTARTGVDTDVWVMDTTGKARPVVTEGGSWSALDFSPDGKRLIVSRYVSASESHPAIVDLASGTLRMLPVEGGKAAFGGFRFAPDGQSVYFVSDEPIDGRPSEFQRLRLHDPRTGRTTVLSRDIPWDVEGFTLSGDGRHLAFVTNEDGISRLRVLRTADHQPVALPDIPVGVIGGLKFSPDGRRLALSINSATSPDDAYVIDLGQPRLTRWTRSEVGGLDASAFVAPTLIRYPTFDTVDGKPRTIPAFYYRPANAPAGAKLPVIVQIHGGPESQALPTFDPNIQYLVNELGVAVLVPNVRGSSGYGRTYLSLDNAAKREDSVRDIGALLDWIGTQPELDASRIGVTGRSYGGYMALATLTNYPERIRAGIETVGISHFGTFLQNTEDYRRDLRRAEYGDERDPAMKAVFDRISPLNNAGRIRAPLFVAQGRNDPRVPYTEAEQIVRAVRGNDVPVWFLMFNDEGHRFEKKRNADYYNAVKMLFWQQQLLDGAPGAR